MVNLWSPNIYLGIGLHQMELVALDVSMPRFSQVEIFFGQAKQPIFHLG